MCTFDGLSIHLADEEMIKPFITAFIDAIRDELYDSDLADNFDESWFQEDDLGWSTYLEEEPMFSSCEYGAQVEDGIVAFLKKYPNAQLSASYECTFSNCGDQVINEYSYENGILTVVEKHSETPYADNCPHCGHEDNIEEYVACLENWSEDSPCICPECGEEIDLNASQTVRTIDIKE